MATFTKKQKYAGQESITYNEAGVTYNEIGYTYKGVLATLWTKQTKN